LSITHQKASDKAFKLIFRTVYLNDIKEKRYSFKELGTVCVGKIGKDDDKTLGSLQYDVGDLIDICIIDALSDPPRVHTIKRSPTDTRDTSKLPRSDSARRNDKDFGPSRDDNSRRDRYEPYRNSRNDRR
jgi:hypothetical protein